MAKDGRLDSAQNVWVATVRPDGRPHLVPVWFVVDGGRWYICTAPDSVKARNLQTNSRIAVEPNPAVVRKVKEKYDWDIAEEAHYTQVFEVVVKKRVMGSG